jgi:hypothetical protein
MANLLYVPILHTQKEVGKIASAISSANTPIPAEQEKSSSASPLVKMWQGIQGKIEVLNPPWKKVRIYQEALPVCGQEERIVSHLAENSLNHQLIVKFLKRGAHLEGTEEQNLLLREYDLLAHAFQAAEGKTSTTAYRNASETILADRDKFIAQRVKQTLKEEETGLLFIGVRHKVDQLLKQYYQMTYVIYRLPFETVHSIYNL